MAVNVDEAGCDEQPARVDLRRRRGGIEIESIKPGNPQQNGRHERMHLTLKLETTRPAAENFLAQQARFVDLDGPLLLANDRDNGLRYEGSTVYPPDAALWG